jgi:DNA modification methylase
MIRDRIVELRRVKASELLSNPKNWRTHPKAQQDALRGILAEIGFADAVLAYTSERNGGALTLFDGHLRRDTLPEVEIPVLITDLTDDEADKMLATLDPLAAMAGADSERLDSLLRETKMESPEVQKMLDKLAKEHGVFAQVQTTDVPEPEADRAAELLEKWGVAHGQLWIIPSKTVEGGAHRLLCGDSTDPAQVTRVMNGQRAALFATDPPYLVDYDGTNHPHKWNEPDKNKNWSESYHDWDNAEQGRELYEGFVRVAVEHAITGNAAWYCWHASRNQAMLENVWEQFGAFVHQQIIWVKDRPVLTRSHYMWQHEPCFFGWKKGSKPERVAIDHPSTVWQVPTIAPGTSTDHPTSKPLELFAIPMRQHTNVGDICFEPFSGSGSQLIAGEQLGRLVFGLELQPQYVAVVLERAASAGLEPRLENEY